MPVSRPDPRASRLVASDSSLSANASKVLSTRTLLPTAPRRHSAASILSNSGECILSTWPLLRRGQKLMHATIYRCRFDGDGICSLEEFAVDALAIFLASVAAVELTNRKAECFFFAGAQVNPSGLTLWVFVRSRIEDHIPFRHGSAPLNSCDRSGVTSQPR